MAGNVWKWTMEVVENEKRVLRGGSLQSNSNDVAISWRGYCELTGAATLGTVGFRIFLYIE